MLYTDLYFVFAFLPLTIIFSLFDESAEYKNMILVISSLIFFTWGRPIIILLLFLTVFSDYGFAFLAGKEKKSLKYAGLLGSICVNCVFFLVFGRNYLFKAGGIFENFSSFSFSQKLIPLGIAFYTIRGVSYVFDVFKNTIKPEKNPFCLLTYMVSYHFMVAGPIVRYGDIENEIRHRKVTISDINAGLTRFVYGLGKAVVIAPVFEKLMKTGLNFENTTTVGAVMGFVGFVGYYWWAFEGFTDMALGLGKANGFSYCENLTPFRFEKGITKNAFCYNTSLTKFFSDVLVIREKNNFLYALSVVFAGIIIGLWYEFSKGTLGGALIIAGFVLIEKFVINKKFEKLPKFFVGLCTMIVLLLSASFFMVDAFWEWKDWVLALLGKRTQSFSNGEVVALVKENFVLILFGIIFAFSYARDGAKKLGEIITKKFGYGCLRILKTVFTVIILLMYTTQAYQLAL